MSTDSEHSIHQADQDQVVDWEMAALPAAEEPDWYADGCDPGRGPGISDPCWEPAADAPDLDDSGDCVQVITTHHAYGKGLRVAECLVMLACGR